MALVLDADITPADLEERALWHLELEDRAAWMSGADLGEPEDGYDGEYLGHVPCWQCGGEGSIVACMDDLCHGQDWCMHGDNAMCPNCQGEGAT